MQTDYMVASPYLMSVKLDQVDMKTDYMVASPYLMSVKFDQVEVYHHAGLQEVNRIPCVCAQLRCRYTSAFFAL